MQTVLTIDDEKSVRESFRLILSGEYHVLLAENADKGIALLDEHHVDLVLLDLMMPGLSGMDAIERILSVTGGVPVIIVTAMKSVSTAVEAMKRGARDYVIKPFDVEEIELVVARTLEEAQKEKELQCLRREGAQGFESIIGQSPALDGVLQIARRAAGVDSTVLITGESGTGKDMLARAIHQAGPRTEQPFIPVSCCAIPEQLVESELFGHEKGAFTGAVESRAGKVQVADGGTLFLDEIGEMPLDAQAKLLRVLQESQVSPVGSSKVYEVDVRFVCATNRDLEAEVAAGKFREDLFYRINVLPIEMPPLRRRREDLPELVEHFVAKHAPRVNATARSFDADALAELATHEWPGNVRELENVVERVLVHHGHEPLIRAGHLGAAIPRKKEPNGLALGEFDGLPLEEATNRLERHLIQRALERSDHVQSRAADLLGTTRRILKYKMDQLGVGATEESAQTH